MMKTRFEELDVAKGIGIILVVLGHLEPGKYLMRFIYSFSLFLFFACSGIIGARYEERKFSTILRSNCQRLLVPYVFWAIISNAVDVIFGRIEGQQALQNIFFINANVGWNAALWFLPALFWADSLCSLIIKLRKSLQYAFFISAIILWFAFAKLRLKLPLGFYTAPVATVFWLIGYWFNVEGIFAKVKTINTCGNFINLQIWGVINVIFGVAFNSVISIYHIVYHNVFFTFLGGIAGAFLMLNLAILIATKHEQAAKFLKLYGRNTLTILCTHYFILRLIGDTSNVLLGVNLWRYTSTMKAVLFACVVVLSYFPVLKLLEKIKMPPIRAKRILVNKLETWSNLHS